MQKTRKETEEIGNKDGKVFNKSMNNEVYGKVMQNQTKRYHVRLVNKEKDYLKWNSKPHYVEQILIDNDLIINCKIKIFLTISKPAYVGMNVLEFSKAPMYEFHCGYRKKIGKISRLLFTESNSLVHDFET